MGIADTDRTLPCNRMVFDVRRDMALYQRFRQNIEPVMDQYGLDEEEREALAELLGKGRGGAGIGATHDYSEMLSAFHAFTHRLDAKALGPPPPFILGQSPRVRASGDIHQGGSSARIVHAPLGHQGPAHSDDELHVVDEDGTDFCTGPTGGAGP